MSLRRAVLRTLVGIRPIVLGAALLVGACVEQDPIGPQGFGPPLQYHTFGSRLTSSAFSGERAALEALFTPRVFDRPGGVMAGQLAYVGQGCSTGGGVPADDPYLANPSGKIALIDRGGCPFDNKVARAQLAGAIGVIVFNEPLDQTVFTMGGTSPVMSGAPALIGTTITIPAIFIGHSDGVVLRDAAAPVTVLFTPPPPPSVGTLDSDAYDGARTAQEGLFTAHVHELPGGVMAGQLAYVGRGCSTLGGVPADDPYLADPSGKIALIDRGVCSFDNKVARAQLAGAIGVIVFNVLGQEAVFVMAGKSPVTGGAPGLIGTNITIPAISIGHSDGVVLRDAAAPVTVLFTPPPPPTPAQLLQYIYKELDQLAISAKDAKKLRQPLDVAAKKIGKDKTSAAKGMNDFINAVNALEAKGALPTADGDLLRTLAGRVLKAL
jgi:hypothetical protein